jgi:predicted transposase YdaD
VKTDRQVYRLFQANPEWLFDLTHLESPGPSEFRSFTVKSLQRDADGVVVPHDSSQPLTVVEVQFQPDDAIYPRIVTEMAAGQIEHQMRAVQGIILFRFPGLDPQTQPWSQVVRAWRRCGRLIPNTHW